MLGLFILIGRLLVGQTIEVKITIDKSPDLSNKTWRWSQLNGFGTEEHFEGKGTSPYHKFLGYWRHR